MRAIGRHLSLVVSAAVLVAAIWLLVESRPSLPSLSGLTAARGADRLLTFLAWLGCLLLAIGLLQRITALSRRRADVPAAPIRHLHPHQQEIARRRRGGYSERAFPLIPKARTPLQVDSRESEPVRADAATVSEPAPQVAASSSPPAARISVLGPLSIQGMRKRGRGLRGATRELLAYLALHPKGPHRDQIIDALWPDESPEQGRNRLWRAVADARNHLGETILARDDDRYQLDRSQVSIDLDQLESILAELGQSDETTRSLPRLEQALALFNGEPLAGSDLPWAENEQRRLHAIQLELIERIAHAHLANGDASYALASAEAGLAHEPYNEKLARLAMRAEAALGLRSAIISRYDDLQRLLEEQLGLQPHRETRALYRQLLSQDQQPERSGSALTTR